MANSHRFIYVDLNKVVRNKAGKLDVKYAEPDGLHLNQMGYQVWVNLLKKRKHL